MRMWKTDPRLLCRKHLLGEHVEMHMFVGTLNRGIKTYGYVAHGLVELHKIKERHDELVAEMERRGMVHKSPLTQEEIKFDAANLHARGYVDTEHSYWELARRCLDCRDNIEKALLTGNTLGLEKSRPRVLLDLIRTMNIFVEETPR
ncbi:MAG: pyrimidine dimer DNA glycosylase/endonuclease V [Actinobacteria bacterium]|nr:pyrimidine dimer DNA glycosylase/endonuclease V [Actinomycetota bacterium]MCA1806324.1 pyrimidine dimer DNA glycosylase/endonuclease V [Actinomycetota bacterium]